jgi:hypothetical protein
VGRSKRKGISTRSKAQRARWAQAKAELERSAYGFTHIRRFDVCGAFFGSVLGEDPCAGLADGFVASLAKFLESRRIMLGLELPRRADPLLVEGRRQRRRWVPTASPK